MSDLGLHDLKPNPGSTKNTKRLGRGKGSGQGLAIARSIVATKHRGSLTFESEVGKGTTFTIRLPVGDSPGA